MEKIISLPYRESKFTVKNPISKIIIILFVLGFNLLAIYLNVEPSIKLKLGAMGCLSAIFLIFACFGVENRNSNFNTTIEILSLIMGWLSTLLFLRFLILLKFHWFWNHEFLLLVILAFISASIALFILFFIVIIRQILNANSKA
jgi:hypothetical protein